MTRDENLRDPDSCLNKAAADEQILILLARDIAAPGTVRYWASLRVSHGKNEIYDREITEACDWADAVEAGRLEK